ncbi:hypothetical protein LAZ67_20000980 [Cordylochernes scorpioides]|uniref:Transposase n=1 Tax=Cordylochernes scorpioides TaxID=51811 RepID=A0ABY6LPE6_9ARAC|nr:hypothetical protein LAZ67_20000980 [Cordylochernes scorpioides]
MEHPDNWRLLYAPGAFKEGREEVADEPRSGCPTTARTDENVDRVLEVLRTDRRLSIHQIADTLHMSTFVVHGIVTDDLQMRKVCAKLVPKVLTQDQKELRVLRCQELLDLIQNEPGFLNSVIIGDESWMFEYDPESKRQSCAWHTKSSPLPKKARMSKSRIKTMIIVFFDIRGIVHCEFVPQGQTVNSAFYLEVLRRLKRRIARVRIDIKDTVKLHHENATSHTPSSLPTSWPGATPREGASDKQNQNENKEDKKIVKSTGNKRKYVEDYLKYGFIPSVNDPSLPFCLICQKTLSNETMVPSKLLRHIETNHQEQMNNPISYFENIRSSFQKQSKKFKKFMTTSDEAQTASYMIAQLIARKKKAHAEAEEIILPALKNCGWMYVNELCYGEGYENSTIIKNYCEKN